MSPFYAIFAFLAFAGVCSSDEAKRSNDAYARLLVSKQVQNKYLVAGKDIVVKYGLYNIGEQAALDISITDNGFQEADFETLGGQRNIRLDRLAAGANHSHVLVVRPLRAGYFNFTAAEVKYRPAEGVEQIQLGFSSNPGQALIIELKDYEKQFSAHMLDWLAFAVMTLPSLGIPFLLWHSSKSKYEGIARAKKE